MAVTLQADALATELNIPPTTAARLLPVATEMVTRYAPQAPDAMANEGVIRLAGYMASTSHYGAIRSSEVGPLKVENVVNHAMMFRNSGAQALLTQYKVRRAGAI